MDLILHFNDAEEDKELAGNLSESKLIWKKLVKHLLMKQNQICFLNTNGRFDLRRGYFKVSREINMTQNCTAQMVGPLFQHFRDERNFYIHEFYMLPFQKLTLASNKYTDGKTSTYMK